MVFEFSSVHKCAIPLGEMRGGTFCGSRLGAWYLIEGDVPLLLLVSLLRTLHAVVNFQTMSLQLPKHDREVKLNSLPSGYVTIDIMQFNGFLSCTK